MGAQAKKELVGSFKETALRDAKEKQLKEKLGHSEKKAAVLTRENRQLSSKVNQLGFLLAQSYAASQGRKITKVNFDGNGGGMGSVSVATARGGNVAPPPGSPPDRPTSRRQRWGEVRRSHTQASAIAAVLGSGRTNPDSVDPATAVVPVKLKQHHQLQQRPMSAPLVPQEAGNTETLGQATPSPPSPLPQAPNSVDRRDSISNDDGRTNVVPVGFSGRRLPTGVESMP